jgi:hypothetical protein
MPRNSNRKKRKAQTLAPAIRELYFTIPAGGGADVSTESYIDAAKELSKLNRRMYEQGRLYAFQGLTYIWRQNVNEDLASIELTVRTAGNTWMVHNSFVKGRAMWEQMQDLVLDDNPSIKGKWHDFKLRLSTDMVSDRILHVKDGSGTNVLGGEWSLSTFVLPQHDVDPADGKPLDALERTVCLIGDDTTTIKSLVKAYQESRATVQPIDPNVPAEMSTSFFNLLTDTGSQEPELADVIEDENDNPPYDTDEYVGGPLNAATPMTVGYSAISPQEVDGRVGGFVAPCGLIQIEVKGYKADGVQVPIGDMPAIDVLLHVAPGMYKGVAAIPMGQ